MTRHDPLSVLTDDRTRGPALALALAALALLGAVTAVGTTAAQADPTVRVDGGTTGVNETTTVDVVLTSAPNGLSGYNVTLSVADADVARIESASYPDSFALTQDPVVGPNGSAVELRAADLGRSIEAGASNVTLATVEIAGVGSGEAELSLDLRRIDNDNGTGIAPAVGNATVTVTGDGAASGSTGSGDGEDASSGSDDSDDSDGSNASDGDGDTATATPTVTPGEETTTAPATATDTATETDAAQEAATTEAAAAGTASATAGGNTTETTTPLSPFVVLAALAAGTLALVGRHRRR